MARHSGLGRGLGALIPTEVANGSGSLREIPLTQIQANPFQPRSQFAEEALSALVDSIKAMGVLQPVLVRPAAGGYELIAGERRCRAARRAGLQTIPALVQEVSDATSLEQALVENIQREQLNALDEAAAYQQLIEDFGLTHDEVARRVGRSRVSITNSLRLFQLPPQVQRMVKEERLSPGHARALLGTPDRELQGELAVRAVRDGLSVRSLEALVRRPTIPAPDSSSVAPEVHSQDPEGSLGEARSDGEVVPGSSVDALEQEAESPGISGLSPSRSFVREGVTGGSTGAAAPLTLRPPGFLELEEVLAAHLDTRVRVEMSARHGRVVIDFATLEDLERIYRVMVQGRPPA